MAKGFRGGGAPGGGNMQQMLKQAQKMQEDMAKAQQEAQELIIDASAGGGMVTARVNGKKEVLELNISPEVVDPDDIEMLQDLIVAAVNEAILQADALVNERMGKITGGLNIPGLS